MRKSFLFLWIISVLSVGAGIPYAFELQKEVIASAPFPLPALVLITLAQTAVMLGLATYIGKKLSTAIGMEVFALKKDKPGQILKFGVPMGIFAAAAIYIADLYFSSVLTPQLSIGSVQPALWKTLLASFYGGVVEEVLMRLFLMTFVVWVISKVFRVERPIQNKTVMWGAIVVAAIIFGLGHLPVTAAITAITPLIVIRAITLNGIGGLIFGWLYWRKGLEYGVVAHFTADIFLLAILPALMA
jgi:membrane protease YdiL (CAAX protease family)